MSTTTTIAILRFIRTNNNIFANYRIFTGFSQPVEKLKIYRFLPRASKNLPVFKMAKVKNRYKKKTAKKKLPR